MHHSLSHILNRLNTLQYDRKVSHADKLRIEVPIQEGSRRVAVIEPPPPRADARRDGRRVDRQCDRRRASGLGAVKVGLNDREVAPHVPLLERDLALGPVGVDALPVGAGRTDVQDARSGGSAQQAELCIWVRQLGARPHAVM